MTPTQPTRATMRAGVTDSGRSILHLRDNPVPVHASLLVANAPSERPGFHLAYGVHRGMFAHVSLVTTTDGAALQLDLIAIGRTTTVAQNLDGIFQPWFPNAQALVDDADVSKTGLSEVHHVLDPYDFALPYDLLQAFIRVHAHQQTLVPASLFLLNTMVLDPDLNIE